MRDVMSSAIPQEVDTTLHVVTLPPLGVQWVCVWCNGDNVTISTLLYYREHVLIQTHCMFFIRINTSIGSIIPDDVTQDGSMFMKMRR